MSGGDQCEVVLVGCGVPLRGMGWYHSTQLLKGKCPSAKLSYVVEPWFLGPGTYYLQQAKKPGAAVLYRIALLLLLLLCTFSRVA